MSDVPDGFKELIRGGSSSGPATGISASVRDGQISFSGQDALNLPNNVRIAMNGTRFAVASDGDFKVTGRANGSRVATNPRGSLPRGRYVGHREGDWWVFEPVSE